MSSIILFIIVAILFLLGLAGIIIPALPGIGLIFIGIGLYAFATGFTVITLFHLVLFGLITVLALATSYVGSLFGTRAGGGQAPALFGTVVGAVLGLMTIGPLGLFAGAFVGAMVGALSEGKTRAAATKTAVYSVIGIVGGTIVQLVIGLAMIIAFVLLVV